MAWTSPPALAALHTTIGQQRYSGAELRFGLLNSLGRLSATCRVATRTHCPCLLCALAIVVSDQLSLSKPRPLKTDYHFELVQPIRLAVRIA